jgi:hypothetical protein
MSSFAIWAAFLAVGLVAGLATWVIASRPRPRFPKIGAIGGTLAAIMTAACVGCQIALLVHAFLPSLHTAAGPQMTDIGLVILLFGVSVEVLHLMKPEKVLPVAGAPNDPAECLPEDESGPRDNGGTCFWGEEGRGLPRRNHITRMMAHPWKWAWRCQRSPPAAAIGAKSLEGGSPRHE